MSIYLRLREERERLGMSQEVLGALGGVQKRAQINYEKGERHPDTAYLAAVAAAGIDVLYVLTGECVGKGARTNTQRTAGKRAYAVSGNVSAPAVARENMHAALEDPALSEPGWADFVRVPRYDIQASAGPGSLVNDECIVDHLAFKRDWLTREMCLDPKRAALIDVVGDSMQGTIDDGDLILLDTRPQHAPADGIYVINLRGALHVKRLQAKLNGEIEVVSDNPRYGRESISGEQLDQLQVVGRVVWQGRKI